jgi:hypothetical protein
VPREQFTFASSLDRLPHGDEQGSWRKAWGVRRKG